MPHAVLTHLLVVQDRDARRRQLEQQLAAVPADRKRVEAEIAAEHAAIETARAELRELETRKKLLQTESGSLETRLARYRTQQLEVRKNDEYQALGHEIATTTAALGALEERELGLLYELDGARARFTAAETALQGNIARHRERLATFDERERHLGGELAEARAAAAAAREGLPEFALRTYERVAARHWPAVAPLRAAKCGGCHLKVSAEAESGARSADPTKLGICDQCGRLLYFDHA
jgi:uncharacterized protein